MSDYLIYYESDYCLLFFLRLSFRRCDIYLASLFFFFFPSAFLDNALSLDVSRNL